MKYRVLVGVACLMVSTPAFAEFHSACVGPYEPNVPNGASATMEQMNAAAAAVKDFIAKSDDFQDCLKLELQTQKDKAAKEKTTFDTNIQTTIYKLVNSNQSAKERVGGEYNAAAKAFNDAHKKP